MALVAIPAVDAQDAPNLQVLRAAYVNSVTSIRTARLDQRITWDRDLPLPPARLKGLAKAVELKLVTDGHRQALLETTVSPSGRRSQRRAVFDGHTYSFWNATGKVPGGTIGPERPPELASWNDVFHFLGVPRDEIWSLPELLRDVAQEALTWETVDGTKCIKVAFSERWYRTKEAQPKIRQSIWFDPSFGYLPRRIRVDLSDFPNNSPPADFYDYQVLEFSHVPTGEGGVWVPRLGTIDTRLVKMRVEVIHCALNVPVQDADFQHTFPDGCFVGDRRIAGNRRHLLMEANKVVAEGPAVEKIFYERAFGMTTSSTPGQKDVPIIETEEPSAPISARPSDHRRFIQPYLILAGITLVGLGAALWWRRRRQPD